MTTTDLVSTSERLLTVREVASELRCSKAHVHNLINGKVPSVTTLPSVSLGRRRLVRRESLNSWVAQNEQGAHNTIEFSEIILDALRLNHADGYGKRFFQRTQR